MTIDFTITIGDILSLIGILIAILLAFWQLSITNKQNRSEIILGMMDKHIADAETLQMLYMLEYGNFSFEPDKFPMSAEEKILDKLLYSFDQIAKLHELGILKKEDLSLIEYDYLRVFTNIEVQKYFKFLDSTPNGFAIDTIDFKSYRTLAKYLLERRGRV